MRWPLKRWYVSLGSSLCIVLAGVSSCMQHDKVTQASHDRIAERMKKGGITENEVLAILGQEGDHSGWPKVSSIWAPPPEHCGKRREDEHRYTQRRWIGEDGY